jgi:ADP-heptose:LPS heptosyltransferase
LCSLPGFEIVEIGRETDPLGAGINLIDGTTVPELAAVLRDAHIYIGNDSGPLHLALAVGTPAVGIFGATDARLLIEPRPGFFPVLSPAECRFCWSRMKYAYPDGTCPREDFQCMESISLDTVKEEVKKALRHAGVSIDGGPLQ